MAKVTLNGKEITGDKNKKIIHLVTLGTRSQEVGATFFNSALSPFTVKIDPETLKGQCEELETIAAFFAKNPDVVAHITDNGQDTREREITLGKMSEKINAALSAVGLFRAMEVITEPVKGGVTMLSKSDSGKSNTKSAPIVTDETLESLL